MAGAHTNRSKVFREKFERHLDHPTTLLSKIRDAIFGRQTPDRFTQIIFWISLAGWAAFMLWNVLGYMALKLQHLIINNKSVNVDILISNRGIQLGYDPREFLSNMQSLYGWSIFAFCLVFLGAVLLWRRKFAFVWPYFSGMLLYPLLILTLGGVNYFNADVTAFDKILWFVMFIQAGVYAFFLRRNNAGEDIDFFGIDED